MEHTIIPIGAAGDITAIADAGGNGLEDQLTLTDKLSVALGSPDGLTKDQCR